MELIFSHHHCSWGWFLFSGRILSPWWACSRSQSGTIALPVVCKSKEACPISLKMNLGWKCLPVPLLSVASLLLSSTMGWPALPPKLCWASSAHLEYMYLLWCVFSGLCFPMKFSFIAHSFPFLSILPESRGLLSTDYPPVFFSTFHLQHKPLVKWRALHLCAHLPPFLFLEGMNNRCFYSHLWKYPHYSVFVD